MIKVIADILKVFANNNLFEEGVELIRSWSFQIYQKHLGAKSFPLRTQDNIALQIRLNLKNRFDKKKKL